MAFVYKCPLVSTGLTLRYLVQGSHLLPFKYWEAISSSWEPPCAKWLVGRMLG